MLVGGPGLAIAAFAEGMGMRLHGTFGREMDMGIDGPVYHQGSHGQDQQSCCESYQSLAKKSVHSNAKEVNR